MFSAFLNVNNAKRASDVIEKVLAKARDIERATRERAAEREAGAERRRLVAKARDPRVRHMLWPFLAKGYALPNGFTGNGYSLYRKGDAEGPMSFGALRANGALERTVEGRARLVQIAVGLPEEGEHRVDEALDGVDRSPVGRAARWSRVVGAEQLERGVDEVELHAVPRGYRSRLDRPPPACIVPYGYITQERWTSSRTRSASPSPPLPTRPGEPSWLAWRTARHR